MALLVCAPLLLGRGFALTRDMVFVPREPFKPTWLGLDGSVPRAVPSDAVVSLVSTVLPGDIVQKAVLVALLLLAGGGAATVVSGSGLVGRLAASTLYVWNPYVFERLAMGHWALLCGYAALPWVLVASVRVREGGPRGWPLLAVALAAAAFTSPTGGVLAAVTCCCVLIGRDRRRSVLAVACSLVLNLPWVVPSLLYRGGIPSDPAGVSAFAAHPDTPYGTLGSLVSLGGIWNSDVVPPGRESWLISGFTLLVCLGAIGGLCWARGIVRGLPLPGLVVLGALGLALAALPTLPGGLATMQWVDVHLPGAGLLRDSQKWVALLALAEAIGVAALVTRLRDRWRAFGAQADWWLVAGSVLMPVAVLPSMAWGLAGRLEPVRYPSDWSTVASLLDRYSADGRLGDVAVLPWSIYRQFGWNADRPALDPAPRYLPGDVVIADTLVVGSRAVGGEDPRAGRIGALLRHGSDVADGLRRLGIGVVVVERGTPGVGRDVRLPGDPVFAGRWLQLWLLGPPTSGPAGPSWATRASIVVGDAAAGGLVVASVGLIAWRPRRRYSRE